MKRKKWMFFLMVLMVVVCISGCSSIPKEKKIKEDISSASSLTENLLSDDEKIIDVEIKDRQTDKKQKYDHVICSVMTEKENISYEKEVSITYYKYDNGWSMQDISVNDSNDWIVKPLKGISEKQIMKSLDTQIVTVDGESWDIQKDEVSEISIKKQKTDLDKQTDNVTFKVTLNGEVETATGTVKAEYEFDKKWILKSMEDQNDFKAKPNPEKALKIDENGLIQALNGRTISIGVKKNDTHSGIYIIDTSTQQEIEINSEDISEFSINNQEKRAKGTAYVYECSCKLVKADVKYTLQIQYYYDYANNWESPIVTIDTVLNNGDINLSGKWKGTYNGAGDDGTVELDITSDDGINYSGTYTYTSNKSYGHAGGYEVSGTFNIDTMKLELTAGEWSLKPDKPSSFEKEDISAIYYVNDSKLEGRGQDGDIFDVSRE